MQDGDLSKSVYFMSQRARKTNILSSALLLLLRVPEVYSFRLLGSLNEFKPHADLTANCRVLACIRIESDCPAVVVSTVNTVILHCACVCARGVCTGTLIFVLFRTEKKIR